MATASEGSRREFLSATLKLGALSVGSIGLGGWLTSRSARPVDAPALAISRAGSVPADPTLPELVFVTDGEPDQLTRAAVDALGGIRRFVARGDVVVIKPNIGWDRAPEQAANTNPDVVASLIRLCQEAGARRVIVTDVSCNEAPPSFERSGIAAAARHAGAQVVLPEARRFKEVDLKGDTLGVWPVLEPFLSADKVINVPVAKHHSLTGVTLGLKNWYGILGGQRSRLHQRIDQSLADLAAFMRPALTVLDAYRVLMRNGPTGGSLADVDMRRALVAGTDPVAVDAFAATTFFDLDVRRLAFLRVAAERGLGRMHIDEVRLQTIAL